MLATTASYTVSDLICRVSLGISIIVLPKMSKLKPRETRPGPRYLDRVRIQAWVSFDSKAHVFPNRTAIRNPCVIRARPQSLELLRALKSTASVGYTQQYLPS